MAWHTLFGIRLTMSLDVWCSVQQKRVGWIHLYENIEVNFMASLCLSCGVLCFVLVFTVTQSITSSTTSSSLCCPPPPHRPLVKVGSGSHAVFTEQESSASQMTAEQVKDVITRLLGCAGRASDQVSADTQDKMEDLANLFKKLPESVFPTFWLGLPRHQWPKA